MAESKYSGVSRGILQPSDVEEDEYYVPAKATPISPTSRPAGVELNLSAFNAADGKSSGPAIQEKDILVIFDLPDGSISEHYFKLGQTVEVLKSFVDSEFGIPMQMQTLYLEDVLMMDPLSLLDYPEAKGSNELYVRVDGPMPSESKK
jgi:hypothetical protein